MSAIQLQSMRTQMRRPTRQINAAKGGLFAWLYGQAAQRSIWEIINETTTKVTVRKAINECRKNAQRLIDSAQRVLEIAPNIAYHLATLALEEIGKAYLFRFSGPHG